MLHHRVPYASLFSGKDSLPGMRNDLHKADHIVGFPDLPDNSLYFFLPDDNGKSFHHGYLPDPSPLLRSDKMPGFHSFSEAPYYPRSHILSETDICFSNLPLSVPWLEDDPHTLQVPHPPDNQPVCPPDFLQNYPSHGSRLHSIPTYNSILL